MPEPDIRAHWGAEKQLFLGSTLVGNFFSLTSIPVGADVPALPPEKSP